MILRPLRAWEEAALIFIAICVSQPAHSVPPCLADKDQAAAEEVALSVNKQEAQITWHVPLQGQSPRNQAPVLNQDASVMMVAAGATVLGLSSQSGSKVWSATLGGDVRSMSVHGPWLLVATDNEALNGIETTSGRVMWTLHADEEMAGPAVTSDNLSAYVVTEKALTRVDVATGKATQVCDWSSNYYTPFVGPMWLNKDASQVFAMSLSGTVYAFSTTDGSTIWENKASDYFFDKDEGALLSRDGSMLFVPTKKSATERGLRGVSTANGSTLWRVNVKGADSDAFKPHTMAQTPDGSLHALTTGTPEVDRIDPQSGVVSRALKLRRDAMNSFDMPVMSTDARSGRLILTGSSDWGIVLVDSAATVKAIELVGLDKYGLEYTNLLTSAVVATEGNDTFFSNLLFRVAARRQRHHRLVPVRWHHLMHQQKQELD